MTSYIDKFVAQIYEVCRDDETYTAERPKVLHFGTRHIFQVIKTPGRNKYGQHVVRNFQLFCNGKVVSSTVKELHEKIKAFLARFQAAATAAAEKVAAAAPRTPPHPQCDEIAAAAPPPAPVAAAAAAPPLAPAAAAAAAPPTSREQPKRLTRNSVSSTTPAAEEDKEEEEEEPAPKKPRQVIERMEAAIQAHDYDADAREQWIESQFDQMRTHDTETPVALLLANLRATAESHRAEWSSNARAEDEQLVAEYKEVLARISARCLKLEVAPNDASQ